VAEHDARYGEEGAGPPDWAPVRDRWRVPGRLVHDDEELIGQVDLAHRSRFTNRLRAPYGRYPIFESA